MTINKCKCGKKLSYGHKKCRSCANMGDLNGGFIDGRTLEKHFCIDCKINEISYENWRYGNKRCQSCAKQGKNHPNFKHGKTYDNHCEDCGKLLGNYRSKRCLSCSHRGKNNSNYINGEGRFPYPLEFTDELKESIRKRDNYTCQNCGMTEEEHLIVYGSKLSIHHIDYNKNNCKENNLITLCQQCNLRANFNRNYWYAYFYYIMEELNV